MSTLHTELLRDAQTGLSLPQKTMSPKWFYDTRGSELFEDITTVPEYYPTRTELSIFESMTSELAKLLPSGGEVIEFGSGSGRKTVSVLKAIEPIVFRPIDIAGEFLQQSADEMRSKLPGLNVEPIVADFTKPLDLPATHPQPSMRLGFFPGSTLGNLTPDEAISFMNGARKSLGEGSYFLLGVDLIKEKSILEAAYDDAAGVTAAFNLNLLLRMNREIGADFDLEQFDHRAVFNEELSRIEMHLVSKITQTVTIQEEPYEFTKDETIHTENSYKYSVDSLESLIAKAGWSLTNIWTDPKDWFGVFLLKAV